MPPDENSPLENLEKRIYEAAPQPRAEVPGYTPRQQPHPYGWNAPPPPPPKKHMPWAIRFLIITGIFLVLAGATAAFLIWHGTRSVSSDRVTIDVRVPASIASGDTVPIVITIHNGNPTPMQGATLYASLPSGTRSGDTDELITQYNDSLGTIQTGGDVTRTIQAKLFGTENQVVTIPVHVEYHTDGSNALFVSNKEATITVSTSPLSVQVQTLSQTPSGQPLTLTVSVRSNASTAISNVALTVDVPQGFRLSKSDPQATANNFYTLGDFAPGQQKTLTLTGTLTGDNLDQKVFHFTVGSVNPDGTSTLGNSYASTQTTVAITHPFLNVTLSLNQQSADTSVVEPGAPISGFLTWENAVATTLTNTSIRVMLSGNALDQGSITGGSGFYRSSDSSIVFDQSTNAMLASLSSGDRGAGSFAFAIKQARALTGVTNPMVTLTVSVNGTQSGTTGSAQSLTSTLTRTLKVGTVVSISSSLARANGQNPGPVPPRSGMETNYVVTLTSHNTLNSVGAATMSLILPSYVRYNSAAGNTLSYAENTRTLTWNVGDLAPNATATQTFQITFTPSDSQKGTSPTVVGNASFSGVDRFTGQTVRADAPAVTTELPNNGYSGTVQ